MIWKLALSIVVFLMTVKFTGDELCVSVATSTLVLPSANVSMVPVTGSAETIGSEENTLRTINNARMTEREALACAWARVGGIGPADHIRGLCRLRREGRKNIDNKIGSESANQVQKSRISTVQV